MHVFSELSGAYRVAERIGTYLGIDRYAPAALPAAVVVGLPCTR